MIKYLLIVLLLTISITNEAKEMKSYLELIKEAQDRQHTVSRGDNFWNLDKKYGLPPGSLEKANSELDPKRLIPGMTLKIPSVSSNSQSKAMPKQHIIASGQTLWHLNRKYKLAPGTLQKLNKGLNFNNLRIGTKIKLPLKNQRLEQKPLSFFRPSLQTKAGILMQQSSLNPRAIGKKINGIAGKGIAQIRPAAVSDVNRLFGTKYTIDDAYNPRKSLDILDKYISYFARNSYRRTGKFLSQQDKARIWNGGPKGYMKSATLPYIQHIKDKLRKWQQFKWHPKDRRKLKQVMYKQWK